MKHRFQAYTPYLFLLLSLVASAHHEGGGGLPTVGVPGITNSMTGIGVYVTSGLASSLSASSSDPVFIIGVGYRGLVRGTENHHLFHKWLQVSMHGGFNLSESGEAMVDSVRFNIVPMSEVQTSHTGTTTALRYFPAEVRPRGRYGLNYGATVNAIGFMVQNEGPLSGVPHGEADEHRLATLVRFAQIAVDVIGLRYANFSDNDHFLGGQVGTLQVIGGLGWNITQAVSVRVSLGARGELAMGGNLSQGGFMMLGEAEFFNRIEVALRTAYMRLAIYADLGMHAFRDIQFGEAALSAHTHDEATGGLSSFLFLGLNLAF